MRIAQMHRLMNFTGAVGVAALLQGCAFVSHRIDPDVAACIDGDGKAHLIVQNLETVSGSLHTPFDYGNKSVNRFAYEVVVPLAKGQWNETSIEVFGAKFRQERKRGSVTVTTKDLLFDLYVAARDLPNYPLVPIQGVAAGRGEAYLRSAPRCAAGA
jgi:hypothetical protein